MRLGVFDDFGIAEIESKGFFLRGCYVVGKVEVGGHEFLLETYN